LNSVSSGTTPSTSNIQSAYLAGNIPTSSIQSLYSLGANTAPTGIQSSYGAN
jgi:hypothetical protein